MVGASSNPVRLQDRAGPVPVTFEQLMETGRSWRAKFTCQFCLNRPCRCGIRLNARGDALDALLGEMPNPGSSQFPTPRVFHQSSAGRSRVP
jgi:hypothetical protein